MTLSAETAEARRKRHDEFVIRTRTARGLQERLFQIAESQHPQQIAERAAIRAELAKREAA